MRWLRVRSWDETGGRGYTGRIEQSTEDEARLLDAWAAGDRSAGDELMRRYYRGVLRFFDLRASSAAEDLTQRTLLTCAEIRGHLRNRQSFKSFLFGIARNQLMRHFRSTARESSVFEFEFDGDESAAAEPTVSRVVALHEEQHLLLRALQTLPLDSQIVLELFYWESMLTPEIAEVLEIPLSTVTTRLSRARQALRRAVETLYGSGQARESLLRDIEQWSASLAALTTLDRPRSVPWG